MKRSGLRPKLWRARPTDADRRTSGRTFDTEAEARAYADAQPDEWVVVRNSLAGRGSGPPRFRAQTRPPIPAEVDADLRRRSQGHCEAQIPEVCPEWLHKASQRHHRLRRGQGGPDTVANLVHLCDAAHDHVHAHPRYGYESGLLIRKAEGPPTEAWDREALMVDNDPPKRVGWEPSTSEEPAG